MLEHDNHVIVNVARRVKLSHQVTIVVLVPNDVIRQYNLITFFVNVMNRRLVISFYVITSNHEINAFNVTLVTSNYKTTHFNKHNSKVYLSFPVRRFYIIFDRNLTFNLVL